MLQTFKNAWKLDDIRGKLLFTLLIIVLYRIGAVIPVPYVNSALLQQMFSLGNGSIFQYMNILSGDAFSKATLFALSISPYITSSIVIQLLTIAIPYFEKLQKSGEEGRKKLTQITRYVTVGLALVTALGYYMYMRNVNIITDKSFFAALVIIVCYCTGSALIMWLAEQINESGIGNGISIILFANIVAGGPALVQSIIANLSNGICGILMAVLTVVFSLAIVAFVVFMTLSERRIPVQYAKKVVGRKMYGGQSSNIPIKLNMSGVMPIIFANAIVSIPSTLALIFPQPAEGSFWYGVQQFFSYSSPFYAIIFFILIIAFSYFYIAISFNPIEVANNLKKNGGFVPGIRPGKPTTDYLTKILNKMTLIGALFLSVIAVFPLIVNMVTSGALGAIAFGGSSLLIVVGVVLETVREIESQITMRHFKGFLE